MITKGAVPIKICILAAGKGTRMGVFSTCFHKSLLPLGNKAVISHIISQFGEDHEYVIPIGYLGQQIRDFFKVVYPRLNVTFVEVSHFEGKGSGPGLSLYSCRKLLQESFVFTSCDTLIPGDISMNFDDNWIGVKRVNDPENWCSVKIKDENVSEIHYRKKIKNAYAFIGIGHVKDFLIFWNSLKNDSTLLNEEIQVSNGLEGLRTSILKAVEMPWIDTGNIANYCKALPLFEKNFSFENKVTDVTYKYGESIVKLFKSKLVAEGRSKRAKKNKGIFAELLRNEGCVYSYKYVDGKVLASSINYSTCEQFLNWAKQRLWHPMKISESKWESLTTSFYKNKSLGRLELFKNKTQIKYEEKLININGLDCLSVNDIISGIPTSFFQEGTPSIYHGDLHADNVIIAVDSVVLIDWRDCFGDSMDIGDMYYDLAKFFHTLNFSVNAMDNNFFQCTEVEPHSFSLSHRIEYGQYDAVEAFWHFCKENRLDKNRIRFISALVFINMAPLYSENLGKYLYLLGRYELNRNNIFRSI
jgi:choline kinase